MAKIVSCFGLFPWYSKTPGIEYLKSHRNYFLKFLEAGRCLFTGTVEFAWWGKACQMAYLLMSPQRVWGKVALWNYFYKGTNPQGYDLQRSHAYQDHTGDLGRSPKHSDGKIRALGIWGYTGNTFLVLRGNQPCLYFFLRILVCRIVRQW